MADVILSEVSLYKILPELFRESDFIFAGQRVALTSESGPDVFKVWVFPFGSSLTGHSLGAGPTAVQSVAARAL